MTINGQDWTHDLMTFTYTHIPTVSYINPTRATTSGKPIVGVHGYNFVDSSNLKCRFSNETETLYVFARWRTTEWIDCASPVVLVTGSMNVAVTNNGEEYSSENMMLEYVEGATVTSLVPSTGPITGGTNIIVSGTNFEFSSLLSCRFGTDSTVPASYVSNNMVMCRSPKSNAAHVVPVVLVNGGAVVSSHLDAQYTYTEASRVLSITPDSVPTTGNATIQIQGLHFSNVSTLQCVFGEEKILAPAVYVSDTILECNTPVMSRPTKSIVVEVYIHSEYTTSDNIDMSFHSPPRTMSTSPREGSIQGGETISVYGHNFQDNQHLSCWFGTLQSPSVKFVSSKQIQCVSPLLESAADMLVSVSNNNVRLETVLSETAPVFSFKATIRVVSIAPLFGPSSGGTEIILTGEHFFGHAQAYCLFDMKKVKASFSDANKMSCIAPSAGIGQSTVRFSVNGVVLSDDTHMYNYITVPTITTISPSWSFVTGNVTVHITGTSFINSSTLACVVGDITVPATFRNTTNVECIIPSVSEPTNAIVQIDINGQDRTSDGTLFQYRKTPQVLMVSPRAGPNTGGTTIDVIGNNFVMWNNDVYCVFDNTQETQAVWISVTRCTCVSPPSLDGLKKDSDLAYEVSFRLKSAHVDFPAAKDAMAFKYLPPMSVNSFTPKFGSVGGTQTTLVTIIGQGFHLDDALQCRFGTVTVFAKYLNSTMIQCMAPHAISASTVSVGVSNDGSSFATAAELYTFTVQPFITSVYPSSGALRESIVVIGSNFPTSEHSTDFLACRFDGTKTETKGIFLNTSAIKCPLPITMKVTSGVSTSIQLSLSFNGHDVTNSDVSYTLLRDMSVNSFTPSRGHSGTDVVVQGLNFVDSSLLTCKFETINGDQHTYPSYWMSSQTVRCVLPSLSAGVVTVHVTNNGVDWLITPQTFTVIPVPTITSIIPTQGVSQGGTQVVLHGEGFVHSSSIMECMFGNVVANVAFVSTTELMCVAPVQMNITTVDVLLIMNGKVLATSPTQFSYYLAPHVTSIAPRMSTLYAPRIIDVYGTGFMNGDAAACKFGNQASVPATFISSNHVQCLSPSSSSNDNQLEGVSEGWIALEVTFNGMDWSRDGIELQLSQAASISTLTPSNGFAKTTINVYGQNFVDSNTLSCKFDGIGIGKGLWVSRTLMTCLVPKKDTALCREEVFVQVSNNGVDFTSDTVTFMYTQNMVVSTIVPSISYSDRGSDVLLIDTSGRGIGPFSQWNNTIRCRFGVHTTSAVRVNDTAILCAAPPQPVGIVQVDFSTNGIDYFPTNQTLTYLETPTLTAILPQHGSVLGGSEIFVAVSNMPTLTATCWFGDSVAVASFTNTTHIKCVVPPHTAGDVLLAVEWHSVTGRFTMEAQPLFTYYRVPHVSRARPSQGSYMGGTNVVVHGSDFQSSRHLSCTFGDATPTRGRWINSSAVECASPSYQPGNVQLSVTNDGIHYVHGEKTFEYMPRLFLQSITPSKGPVEGGTIVIIRGSSFTPSASQRCRFGHVATRAIYINNTAISCVTPHSDAHASNVDVTVTRNDEEYEKDVLSFEYYMEPTVTSIYPREGPASSVVTTITIRGQGFNPLSTMCRVSGMMQPQLTQWVSSTTIKCQVSITGNTIIAAPLEISNNGQNWISSFDTFRSYVSPQVDNLEPFIGSEMGGTAILVSGYGFLNRVELKCLFGDLDTGKMVLAEWISTTLIQCNSPSLVPGVVSVRVSNNGIDFSGRASMFTYHPTIHVHDVVPKQGTHRGGTSVVITTANVVSSGSMVCHFGKLFVVKAVYNTDRNEITCVTPATPQPISLVVSFSINGMDVISTGMEFNFTGSTDNVDFTTLAMTPISGSVFGGTQIMFNTHDGVWNNKARDLVCIFGTGGTTVTAVRNGTSAVCVAPASNVGPSVVVVSLTDRTSGLLLGGNTYTYYRPMAVMSFAPTFGSVLGGTRMLLRGANFLNASSSLSCIFGDKIHVPAKYRSPSLLECVVPPSLEHGARNVTVAVTHNKQTKYDIHESTMFQYTPVPAVAELKPTTGPLRGNTVLTIIGRHLDSRGQATCTFNDDTQTTTTANVLNSTHMQCKTPPTMNAVGALIVHASFNGIERVEGNLTFQVYSDPTVNSVIPAEGASGTLVNIKGSGFNVKNAVYICRFSGSGIFMFVEGIYSNSNTSIQCIVPYHSQSVAMKLDVSLNGGADYTDSAVQFQYRRPLRLVSFVPKTGPENGGTVVQITGAHFYDNSNIECTFNDQQSTFATYINSTNIECTSPPGLPGNVQISVTMNGRDYVESLDVFTYQVHAFIAVVSPLYAVSTGGTLLTIHGGNYLFSKSLSCRFGVHIQFATYHNSSTIQCEAPKGKDGDSISVEVSNNGVDFVSSEGAPLSFVHRPSLARVSPSRAGRRSTTILTVTGRNFIPGQTLCKIATSLATTNVLSTTVLTCVMESNMISLDTKEITLSISTNAGIDYSREKITVNVVDSPEIHSMYPMRASLASSSLVLTIRGVGFVNNIATKCSAGTGTLGASGVVEWLSSTQIRCTLDVEHMRPGEFAVRVSTGAVQSNEIDILLVPPPFIDSVTPSFATVNGGGTVQLVGPNLAEATSFLCHFGPQHMVAGKYTNSTHAECIVPRMAQPQFVNLSLSFDGGSFSTNNVFFQYVNVPRVNSLLPIDGSVDGGSTVFISGSGFIGHFDALYKCRFGTVIVEALFDISSGMVQCMAPTLPLGMVHVDVSLNNGIDFTDDAVVFQYRAPVRITSIAPKQGPSNGSTVVLVTGSNFYETATMACQFGDETSIYAHFVNETAIECTNSGQQPSDITVSVTMNGVDYVSATDPSDATFTYSADPYVTELIPSIVTNNGMTVVTVLGRNFVFSLDLSCRFGVTVVEATYHNTSAIECTAPSHNMQSNEPVTIEISNNGHDFTSSGKTVVYTMRPTVHTITPERLSRTTPTTVVVKGKHFRIGSTYSKILVTEDTTKCMVVSSTEAHCAIEPNTLTMTDDVTSSVIEMSSNGVDFSNSGVSVSFKISSSITLLVPSSGPMTSNTMVTVSGYHLSLTSDMHCQLNGIEGFTETPAVTVSVDGVECLLPANRTGDTFITLRDGKNNITTNSLLFHYVGKSILVSLDPTSGPRVGGTEIKVLGDNFIFSTTLVCLFGNLHVPATFISSREVRCVTPTRANYTDTDTVVMTVSSDEQHASNNLIYLYNNMPFVSSVEETIYAVRAGDNKIVVVNGTGFLQNQTTCKLEGASKQEAMLGNVISEYQMECPIPDSPTRSGLLSAKTGLLVSNNGQDYAQTQLHFRFGVQAMLTDVSPRSGPIRGGTLVIVTGVDFLNAPNLACQFGNKVAVAQWVSSTMAQCVSPASNTAGDVRLTLSNNAQRFSQLHDVVFSYYLPMEIRKVEPFESPTEGMRAIRVLGTRFANAELLVCRYNHTVSVPATYVSDEEIVCAVPNIWSDTQQHLMPITISKNGHDFTESESTYSTESTQPMNNNASSSSSSIVNKKSWTVSSVEPAIGPLSGSTTARIRGLNFYNSTQHNNILCRFGNIFSTEVIFVDESTILCVSPPQQSVGSIQITVSMNGMDYSESGVTFTYRRDIALSTVQPYAVAEHNLANTNFRLIGANFINTWRLNCNIAGNYVVGLYVSSTEVRCTLPSNVVLKAGTHDISVSNNGEDFAQVGVFFLVLPAIVVSSFAPTYGSIRGGTIVTIHATNIHLSGVSYCRFTGQHTPRVRASASGLHSIYCVAPRAPEGVGFSHIEISINGMNWEKVTTNISRFEYVMQPTINTLSPNIGAYTGGTSIVLEGSHLHPANTSNTSGIQKCRFTSRLSNFTATVVPSLILPKRIVCMSPYLPTVLHSDGQQSGNAGGVRVAVEFTSNGVDYYTSRNSVFEYVSIPKILSYRPRNGHETGGTHVLLTGLNLRRSSGLLCKFSTSGAPIPAMHHSDFSITCVSPKHIASDVNLMVTINGGVDWFYAPGYFSFMTTLNVELITPKKGTTRGGTGIYLQGSGFRPSSSMRCRFGEQSVQAIYVNKTTILCETPQMASSVVLPIELSSNGVDFVDTQHYFRFYQTMQLSSVTPIRVITGHQINLTLSGERFLEGNASSAMFCKFQLTHGRNDLGLLSILPYLRTQANIANDTLATCTSPALDIGQYIVSIGTEKDSHTRGGVIVTSVPKSSLRRVMPDRCPGMGDCSPIRLYGNHFRSGPTLNCIFGNKQVQAKFISNTIVECIPPIQPAGITSVALKQEGIFVSNTLPFTLYTKPVINSITPIKGPTRGQTLVTLRGDNLFSSSTSYCRFGSAWVASIYINDTTVQCVTPPHFAGKTTVALTLNGVDFTVGPKDTASFIFRAGPSISRITPKHGSILGGTTVSIEGTHLDGESPCCRMGSMPPFPAETSSDATHVYCITPSNMQAEPTALEVSADCNLFSTDNHKFHYITDTRIHHIDPAWGIDTGGTVLHISGVGFVDSENLKCRFSSTKSKSDGDSDNNSETNNEKSNDYYVMALWRSSSMIECVTPPSSPVVSTIEVTINGQDWTTDQLKYDYVLGPQVLQIIPVSGPSKGGTMVRITGRNFNARYLFCRFGTQTVSAIYVSKEELKCVTPSNHKAMAPVQVEVSTNGVDYSTSGETFDYVRLPSVSSLHPSRGPNLAEEDGMVGAEYESSDISHCRFGVSTVQSTFGNKSTFRCARERRVNGIASRYPTVLSMNNGQDTGPFGKIFYEHDTMPSVKKMIPSTGQASGGVVVIVQGFNFTNTVELACKFGDVHVNGQWFSMTEIRCLTPRHIPATVYVEVSNNGIDWSESGIDFTFQADASVSSLYPTHGPERGMTLVTVYGNHFVNSHSLGCRFETIRTKMHQYVSSTEVVCFAPDSRRLGRPASVKVEITNNNQTFTTNAVRYFFDASVAVAVLSPQSGPSSGQSRVIVYGHSFRDYPTLGCKFGDIKVNAFFITSSEIECVTPAMPIQSAPIEVTLNGYDYTFSKVEFHFEPEIIVTNIWPTMGPAFAGGTVVTVRGSGFRETTKLRCRFGNNAIVPARFIDTSTIVCRAPQSRPGLLSFSVSNNLMDFSKSNIRFLYYTDNSVSWVRPTRALITGQRPVFVRGTNFMNSTSLKCRFGISEVRAIFLKKTLVVCQVPSRVIGYGINATRKQTVNVDVSNNGLDYSASHVKFEYLLECPKGNYCPHLDILSVPNGTASTNNGEFNFTLCGPGTFQPRMGQPRCLKCPVGYVCPDFGLSKPIICPAGFVCEKQGLKNAVSKCPSGHYCLQGTKTSDTNDFYGLAPHSYWESTSTDNARVSGGRNLAQYSWIILPETGLLRYNESVRNWKYFQRPSPATGTSRPEHSPTMLTGGESHTTGGIYGPINVAVTRHLRFVKHDSTQQYPIERMQLRNAGLMEDNAMLLAERPFPCPLGMYCKTGAVSNVTIPKNFSHPQRCMDGFFCPFGSGSPEGTGPCPTGYYCGLTYTETIADQRLQRQKLPIYEATACPVGMYCPGVGVTSPKPCYPGTYNPFLGQSNCTTCPTGHVCPGWSRRTAEMCPAGFVCMAEGLSEPAVQCPAGYFCLNGTFTLQPDITFGFDVNTVGEWRDIDTYDIEAARQSLLLKLKATKNPTRTQILGLPLQPQACASGTFCLGGVKTDTMIDWIPSNIEGATAPQQCYAGAYCKPGTRTSAGTGPCFPGHYCPPGSGHPVEAPVGNYARLSGAAVPSLCFPGTWAPLQATIKCRVCPAGYTCQSYGTYVPAICPPGTYRSLADSVTCRLCPQGTWAPEYGLQDISQCEPCPEGRMCGSEGMNNLTKSQVCPDGHVCGAGTNKAMQFNHPCPAGYWCNPETAPKDQFSGICLVGAYCGRGTKGYLKGYFKCPVGFYCPPGTADATPEENACPYMTTTAAGAEGLEQCFADEVHVCDKIPGRSYYFEYAYQRLDTSEWTTKSSTRLPVTERTGEVEVLRKILPVNISNSPGFYLNDTTVVYRVCPFNVSQNEFITVIGRNFQDRFTLTCLFRPSSDRVWQGQDNPDALSAEDKRLGFDYAPHSDQLIGHYTSSAIYESPTRVRCLVPGGAGAPGEDENGTIIPYYVHVANNGMNFSLTAGTIMPTENATRNMTRGYVMTPEEQVADDSRIAKQAVCLRPKQTARPDDSYPDDEEGYRQMDAGWYEVPAMSLITFSFNFAHLPKQMIYDQHYKIAIYVAPSVCEEQRCKKTARVRVASLDNRLDPPSLLDECGALANMPSGTLPEDDPRCIQYKEKNGENKCVGKMIETCDKAWWEDPENSVHFENQGKAYDPLFDQMDDVLINSLDVSPCTRPVPLSQWFDSTKVDKHGVMNISVWALDDSIVKPEVQIISGMFLTATHFLRNITTVSIQAPDRANRTFGIEASETATRKLSSAISYEERTVNMQYIYIVKYDRGMGEEISPPFNLPPTYRQYETGRVLTMFKRMGDVGDFAPVVIDPMVDVEQVLMDGKEYIREYRGVMPGVTWWGAPTNSPFDSWMMTRKYREIWHGLKMNPEGTQPDWNFDQVALPYLPYFSNCDVYDNYIPMWHVLENEDLCELPGIPDPNNHGASDDPARTWERRNYPAFPHQDDIKWLHKLAPLTQAGRMSGVSDICSASFKCRYEENLMQPDVNPRWFEADGHELFQLSQHPVEVTEFLQQSAMDRNGDTGPPESDLLDRGSPEDGKHESRLKRAGGNHLLDDIVLTYGTSDVLLSVPGDSEDGKDGLAFDCTRGCFPREVTFSVRYWQISPFRKKIISAAVELGEYDKDPTNLEYEFGIDLQPMGWVELMIAFAFDLTTFGVVFLLLSGASMLVAIAFYLVVRGSTRLETPPRFRFSSMLMIIVSPAMTGTLLGMAPVIIMLYIVELILYAGDRPGKPIHDYLLSLHRYWRPQETYFLMDAVPGHYMINKIDPTTVPLVRNARMAFAMLMIGMFLMIFGGILFLPKRVSKREKEIEMKRDKQAAKESVWVPTKWKRSNFVFTSVMMTLYAVTFAEFSFWDDFGTYIWQIIIGFRPMGVLMDMITEVMLKEALLTTPVMGAFWVISGMVTLGADDFLDFLLGFLVDMFIMLFERTYFDPYLGFVIDGVIEKVGEGINKIRKLLKVKGKTAAEMKAEAEAAEEEARNRDAGVDFSSGDTVEPILGAFSGYSGDAMGLPYALFPMLLMLLYDDCLRMRTLYGIKEADLLFYIEFSIIIIPFQFVSDVFCLQVQELTHGWKIYDYLVYTRYRFLQRETRWKGLEDSLDECIEEGMRTLDQMCFSSQYYLMITCHTTSIIMGVCGIEGLLRASETETYYNVWGDRMTIPFGTAMAIFSYCSLRFFMWVIDKIGIYRLKHEDTAWHSTLGGPEDDEFGIPRWDELDKIKGASHEAYLMNQKITSETFRFRFLRYNRPWLVNQLPAILTPRTLRRSRPYLIAQLTKILGSVNPDVSSDSDDDDDGRPHFGPVSLSTSSRSIARLWLAQARRRKKLREVVQPLISRARRSECEKCLSRKQLQVLLLIPIEVLGDKFEKEYPSEEFDKVAWKQFFNKNAKFQTLCLNCIQQKNELEKQKAARMNRGVNVSDSDDDDGPKFGPVFLSPAATAIVLKWRRDASDIVRKKGGRVASAALISDDDEDDDESVAWAKKRLKLNAASKALAVRWLRMARARNPNATRANQQRERLPDGRAKAVDKRKVFGKNPRNGKKRKKGSRSSRRRK